jgi:hypothetical protein
VACASDKPRAIAAAASAARERSVVILGGPVSLDIRMRRRNGFIPLRRNIYHGKKQVETGYFQARSPLLILRNKKSVEKGKALTPNH